MGNCKDCRWWDYQLGKRGVCKIITEQQGATALAAVIDYRDVMPNRVATHFVTNEAFGCVQWEAKDAA